MTEAARPRLERGGKRILIADDSPTYREIATRVLVDAGYGVTGVEDGGRALEELRSAEPSYDLLILELNLSKVRGLDVLRRLHDGGDRGDLRTLVVSESLTEHLRRVLRDLELDATLTKNHALRELLYRVDGLLFPRVAEQRQSPRKLGQLPVNYWIGDDLFLQSCFDLSAEGMFVVVADEVPPPVGTALALRFWLPTADRLILCEGEVVWLNNRRRRSEHLASAGHGHPLHVADRRRRGARARLRA